MLLGAEKFSQANPNKSYTCEDHNRPVVFLMEIMERLMLGPDYARWGVLIVCTLVYTDYIIIQCAYIVCTLYIIQSVCTDVCTVCINCVFNVYSVYTVCIQIVCTNMCTVCSDYTRWCILCAKRCRRG